MSTSKRPDITQEEAEEAFRQTGNLTAAAKVLGCSDKTVARRLRNTSVIQDAHKGEIGLDINAFRERHDKSVIIPGKIREALRKLGKNGLYEEDFAKLAMVKTHELRMFRDDFTDNIVTVDRTRRIWMGSTEKAAELRRDVS